MGSNVVPALVRSDSSLTSPWGVLVPSSLKKMKGGDGEQEGIYASLDLPRPGRSLIQDDLGLTLLPGSQIQHAHESPHGLAFESDGRLQPTPPRVEYSKTVFEVEDLSILGGKGLNIRPGDGCSNDVTGANGWNMRQTMAWIEERQIALANQEGKASILKERISLQHKRVQRVDDSRPRYGQIVRGWTKAFPDCRDTQSHKSRRTALAESANHESDIHRPIRAASPLGNRAVNAALVHHDNILRAGSMRFAPQVSSTTTKGRVPISFTSCYPLCPTQPLSSPKQHILKHASTSMLASIDSNQCTASQDVEHISQDSTYEKMHAELSRTKSELYNKTRAGSDAQQVIADLRRANEDLHISVDACVELHTAHSSLIVEYREVLSLYHSLAHKHSSCRGSSSRKLAQRIAGSWRPPLSNDSAYASRSSSIAAPPPPPPPHPSTFTYGGEWDVINQQTHLGIPLIDLTTTASSTADPSMPLFAAPAPTTITAAASPTPNTEQQPGATITDQQQQQQQTNNDPTPQDSISIISSISSTINPHSPNLNNDTTTTTDINHNYANINGFDAEANELYDAIWAQEMEAEMGMGMEMGTEMEMESWNADADVDAEIEMEIGTEEGEGEVEVEVG